MLEYLMEFSAHSFLRDLLVGGNSAVVETMRRILVLKSLFKQQLNILGLTNNGTFNQAFNNCKSHALKFFKKAHNYIRAKQSKGRDQESYISQLEARPFYGQMLQVVAPESIDSLYQFYIDKETDLQEIVENESLNDVVIQILRLIEHMVQFQDYFELFSKIDKRLFLDVIMTNFMMLDMHQSNFTDNPQEFCEEFYDLCYTQVDRRPDKAIRAFH